MLNWLFGLNNLKRQIQCDYLSCLGMFLIKEDYVYLEFSIDELRNEEDKIDELYMWTKLSIW